LHHSKRQPKGNFEVIHHHRNFSYRATGSRLEQRSSEVRARTQLCSSET
jgi:hypothetical protein